MARSAITDQTSPTWTNWVGNQSFTPARAAAPRDEEEVATLVRRAAERGVGVRVAGAGHSFTPVVQTDGLLLDLAALSGVVHTDPVGKRATALAATRIRDFYEPLWQAGLALRNQGDIDTQQIAGAVATGTHGSGTRFTSLSGVVRGARIVTATGDVRDVDGSDLDLLHATQVSVGMLGVVTRLELEVTDAYRLREQVGLRSWDDVMEHWDELVDQHRHFGFFWLPTEESGALYNLDGHGERLADQCYVKVYDEVGPDVADDDTVGRRVDRCYRIFPMVYDPNFHELEYFVALERAPQALQAVRELMLRSLPDAVYPLEVRTVGADRAFLSPQHDTATVVISVSGKPGTDYWAYLRSVDALLADFDARVHWGKLHFMTPERLHALYPRAADFIALRRELDPEGMFLNDHLRPLFA
ncbi:D-arabinono-1,4-lactone oxidase [Nocardioides sp. S-58]|uniref:D-arabinono-1,4-lactone oxidase n=1 Tax=Nocardioides renjunii TaxID=3095075 RepID=A0ABU5KBM9_9ACTN|nr:MULTISPECIES: D-arabinono-1,4-lactone oxidase [unclassified Nocardioides]MDZ5661825.1 D-arabinono-1,4-lactone oxidase [Nocardioides sp. S-58]WQQ24063.1 D-arabinono-1,4-lactone oxidase [Nocardioides sp. S-34]